MSDEKNTYPILTGHADVAIIYGDNNVSLTTTFKGTQFTEASKQAYQHILSARLEDKFPAINIDRTMSYEWNEDQTKLKATIAFTPEAAGSLIQQKIHNTLEDIIDRQLKHMPPETLPDIAQGYQEKQDPLDTLAGAQKLLGIDTMDAQIVPTDAFEDSFLSNNSEAQKRSKILVIVQKHLTEKAIPTLLNHELLGLQNSLVNIIADDNSPSTYLGKTAQGIARFIGTEALKPGHNKPTRTDNFGNVVANADTLEDKDWVESIRQHDSLREKISATLYGYMRQHNKSADTINELAFLKITDGLINDLEPALGRRI